MNNYQYFLFLVRMIHLEIMVGIRKLGKKFKRAGINHITVQLYANRRHEILFEDEKK